MSQHDDEGEYDPVTYIWTIHTPAESNSDRYVKELMAVIIALEEWRPDWERTLHTLQLSTDYMNLGYYITPILLNQW